jgi:hypothetical protein
MGVFATDEQSKIDILDVLVNTETSPVTAITKAEYEQCLKKKSHGQTYLIPSQQTPDSSLNQKVVEAVSVAALGEAIDPTEPGSQPQIGAPLDSLDDALIIGKVNA